MALANAEKMLASAVVLLLMLVPFSAAAQCVAVGVSERLANYCLVNETSGGALDYGTVRIIDNRLKLEGYSNGLGLPGARPVDNTSMSVSVRPTLRFEEDINGGNPAQPLVLGILSFAGDEELYKKSGALAGVGVGLSGRHIYGEGRYLNYRVNGSYAHSPQHEIGMAGANASICSINHISDWWYIDACANISRTRKDITDETNSNLTIVGSHVFTGRSHTYSETIFGVNRYFAEDYTQNQLVLGLDTIHPNGVFIGIDMTFGEAVQSQLSTRFSVSATFGTSIANKPMTLTASYSDATGGMLLGFERDETTVSVSVSYPIWANVNATIGYKKTDSSIDYFDASSPIFGIEFAL